MPQEKLFLSLEDDLLFKEAFTHIDNRNVLIDYLSTITNFDKDYLTNTKMIIDYESILSKTKTKDKNMRGDIIIKFDNYIINLESYSYFDSSSFDKSTSYIMRIFSTQLERGKDYKQLESIIQINIIDNVKTPFTNNIKSNYYLTNAEDITDKKLADKFVIKYYRLDKAREVEYNQSDREMRWLKFIGAKSAKERKHIAKGDELLMEFDNWIEEYVNDEKTKKIFGEWAEKIALDKGIEQGIEQNKTEVAISMIKENIPYETITKITGLSKDKLKNLKTKD